MDGGDRRGGAGAWTVLVATACAVLVVPAIADVTSSGQVSPSRPDGSTFNAGGWLVVGDDAAGQITVGSGGSLRSAGLTLGRQAGGDGRVEVRGSSAIADSLDDLVIGKAGVGELRVLDHARLTTGHASDLWIGQTEGGRGTLVVDGYATADLGGNASIGAWHPESPGRPSVSLDQGATLRFALGNPTGVVAGTAGSFALGMGGPQTATLSAAGAGTLLDVPGVWSLGHHGRGVAELFDDAQVRVGTVHLGVGAAADMLIDGATLNADALWAGTAPHAPATLTADAHSTIQLGAGGLRFGPIPGVTPDSPQPVAAAKFTIRGTLTSTGPIDLGGTTPTAGRPFGHELRLLGHDAMLSTTEELRLGGPTPHDRATLRVDGATTHADTAFVEAGGQLVGTGTLVLDRQLTVVGEVFASGGTLLVDADWLSRFFSSATFAVGYSVLPVDHDNDPHTPPIPTISHGTLAFTDDARLDGTLDLRRSEGFPALPVEQVPWYEPFTIAQTTGAFTGWFDRTLRNRLTQDSALAVVQTESALIAQRAKLGDANLDGVINQPDLDAVLTNWGASTATRAVGWIDGDFNGDGLIEQSDLDAVLTAWGGAARPDFSLTAVPEPAAAIGGLLSATLLRRRPGLKNR